MVVYNVNIMLTRIFKSLVKKIKENLLENLTFNKRNENWTLPLVMQTFTNEEILTSI